jgi:hypothetical protein
MEMSGVGYKIKYVVELIGHGIKENTELAEHETSVDGIKSTFKKIRKTL